MNDLDARIARLSPEKRALFELSLKQGGTTLPLQQSIPRRASQEPAPLSFAQQRLWFLNKLAPNSKAYNQPKAIRLIGDLDVAILKNALAALVKRHEILRTVVQLSDVGLPIQQVLEPSPIDLQFIDLSGVSNPDKPSELQRHLSEIGNRPFDLAQGPMLRSALLKLANADHVLLLVTHHITTDGWSAGILWRELGSFYSTILQGRPDSLPPLPIQYGDFATWQRSSLDSDTRQTELAYWKEQLKGIPTLELPTDRARPAVQSDRGAAESLQMSGALTHQLQELSREEGVTLFMLLLAAFQTLLHRYTGQDDIVVGFPTAGRTRPETEALIGFFVNSLILRTDFSGDPSFSELLGRVCKTALAAYDHQDLPFEKLVEELQPRRDLSRSPLYQVMVAHQNQPSWAAEFAGLSVKSMDVSTETAKFDLNLDTWVGSDGLIARLEYSTDLFDSATAKRTLNHFRNLLEGIITNPKQSVSSLPILTETEKQQLLADCNSITSRHLADKCVHQLIEEQAAKFPDELAVVCESDRLTYRELNQRSNQLAHYLRKCGVGPDAAVGLYTDHSVDMMVGLLGILKAGGAYVPLDPGDPTMRLEFVLVETQAKLLLTQERLKKSLPKYSGRILALDSDWHEITDESRENPRHQVTTKNLVYIIYTSGSTGKPKGVMIEHGGLTNYLNHCVATYPLVAGRGSLVHSSIAFDATITGLFAPLVVGRTVYLLPRNSGLDGLANQLRKLRNFSVVKITPAHLALLSQQIPAQEAEGLTHSFVIGGENLLSSQISFWQMHAPKTLLFNEYGPTENVVGCVAYDATNWRGINSVPIGRAIPNTTVYLLDRYNRPVPAGVVGEIYLGGTAVARGYLNRLDLTQENFLADPFVQEAGARIYRTGDLARQLSDGNLVYIARNDRQVKIRGFRIEPGEIEAVLCQHPAIRQVAVHAHEGADGHKRLVGYFVADPTHCPTGRELNKFLHSRLPAYMVPPALIPLSALPLTPNGKLDHHALQNSTCISPLLNAPSSPPQDRLEFQLTKIWEEVLGVPAIGVRDNFFELGGHSLVAVRLIAQIEKTFGVNLPLAILFEAQTVEQMAGILRQKVNVPSLPIVVAIRAHGWKKPFFVVHGGGGGVLCYADLARHLGSEQPFYGLQSPGFDGEQAPLTEIEAIAARYVQEIRKIQPTGPYQLGGMCIGGIVAFDVAQQLIAAGGEVALLALLDTPYPIRVGNLSYRIKCFHQAFDHHVVKRFQYHQHNFLRLRRENRLAYLVEKARLACAKVASALTEVEPPSERDIYRSKVREANITASRGYDPQFYPGKIILFLASESDLSSLRDRKLRWRDLAKGGIEIKTVPGDHNTMVREPNARILAEELRGYLNRA